jgi:hypothetical protein
MSAMTATTTAVNGSKLLEACGFDRRLCAAIIAGQDNWEELLRTISTKQLQRNVAIIVWQIREALGKDSARAKDIAQGA